MLPTVEDGLQRDTIDIEAKCPIDGAQRGAAPAVLTPVEGCTQKHLCLGLVVVGVAGLTDVGGCRGQSSSDEIGPAGHGLEDRPGGQDLRSGAEVPLHRPPADCRSQPTGQSETPEGAWPVETGWVDPLSVDLPR